MLGESRLMDFEENLLKPGLRKPLRIVDFICAGSPGGGAATPMLVPCLV